MKRLFGTFTILLTTSLWSFSLAWAEDSDQSLSVPKVVLTGVPFDVLYKAVPTQPAADQVRLRVGDVVYEATVTAEGTRFSDVAMPDRHTPLELISSTGEVLSSKTLTVLAAWLSLLPSFVAIGFALLFRQVLPALLAGLWFGATLTYGTNIFGLWYGFLDVSAVYTLGALNDAGHLSIIVFSLTIAGMVGIISKNGGTAGIVNRLVKFANTRRRGQLSTAFLGSAIFFDDYANTMIVGNTMRPITDHLKISRAKLAYIVDSTAAPVASIALITTWIGFEVGLIDEATRSIPQLTETAYSIFLHSLAYSFYTIFALGFVYLVASMGRDFGPMLSAEKRALAGVSPRNTLDTLEGETAFRESKIAMGKERAVNAVLPLMVLVLATFAGIYVTGVEAAGQNASLRDIVGQGDPYLSMVWGSALSVLIAVVLTLSQRLLSLGALIEAWMGGAKSLLIAIIILTLAWALASVNETLHTAEFLASVLSDRLSPSLLPLLIFVLAALMSFATGSSWGVMGIMVPLTIPLAWSVMTQNGLGMESAYILYASIASLLSGAVWGDHCSPISDTTILSSIASECDHIEHVRTQLPYSVFVALVAVLVGCLPAGFGAPPFVSLLAGLVLLAIGLRFIGKPASEEPVAKIGTSAAGQD